MNRLITSVIFGLVSINAVVQAVPSRPRLVVGIVVDQLRTDYLTYLKDILGEKGFRRLMENGAFLHDVDFRQSVKDMAAATAVSYTGAWPSSSGVAGSTRFDSSLRRSVPTLHDTKNLGNYTSDSYSPEMLRLSTISDEIAIDGIGLGAIYSISTDPQQAVIMAGHAGKGALWIDDNTGKWASSTYYPDFPAASRINQYSPLSSKIDTIVWKPSRKLEEYPGLPPQKKYYPFRYSFRNSGTDSYRRFKQSAPANREITDMALEYLRSLNLGNRGEAIDMLNIGYTAAPFKDAKDGDYRIELEDTYLQLDSQLGRLLDEIDRRVGLDKTLIYLTSTGYYDDSVADDPKYRIPGGDFSLRRALSLLNSYFSAKYGNAEYVETIHDGQVYLNHKTIENKGLSAETLRSEGREFILKMSGVAEVFTLSDLLESNSESALSLRLGIDPKTSGDIFILHNPGWTINDDLAYPPTSHPVRYGRTLAPAFLMGPEVEATEIFTPVDATTLAPTVTSILHIRSPNGANQRPLTLK
ncbi:MAG: alkaline phosphatase family protein [Muribaculaceae bacterium]|nr:alkaline phosphatase family protein [Muribaculaceae bacterium]